MLSVSSSVNPFIYAWRIPKYRRALKSLKTVFKKSDLPNPLGSNIAIRNIPAGESNTVEPEIHQNEELNDTMNDM